MSCSLDRYKYVVDSVIEGFNYALRELAQYFGDWAFPILIAIMLPITFLFFWSMYILVPRFVKWYYDETISDKAHDRYRRQGLAFLGFRHSTVIISVIAGVLFYAAIRAAFAVPYTYLRYTIPFLVVLFCLITLMGLLVSGNVPENERDIMKYCKRFLSPTVTGLGLGIATLFLDLLINAFPIVLTKAGLG